MSSNADHPQRSDLFWTPPAIFFCLIHQATYLLRRQLETLEKDFLQEGGFTERLYRARKAQRNQQR